MVKYSKKIQVRLDPSTMMMIDMLVRYSLNANNTLKIIENKGINRSSVIRSCIRTVFEKVNQEIAQKIKELADKENEQE